MFFERFTQGHGNPEAVTSQVSQLESRLQLVDQSDLVPLDWSDDELAKEQGIELNPIWKSVELPLIGANESLEVASVVSPWLHGETGEEVGRYLSIIGKTAADDRGYATIGTVMPGRHEGDLPILMIDSTVVSWESADAAMFMHLADQLLPEEQ